MSYYCPVTHTRSKEPCKCTIAQRINACTVLHGVIQERPAMQVPNNMTVVLPFGRKTQHRS